MSKTNAPSSTHKPSIGKLMLSLIVRKKATPSTVELQTTWSLLLCKFLPLIPPNNSSPKLIPFPPEVITLPISQNLYGNTVEFEKLETTKKF